MPASEPSRMPRDFATLAAELTSLSPELLDELSLEATTKHTSPGQLALQKGLLDAAQVDIIETLLRPTEVVPGYEILGVLGQGGMGVVYRARQLNLKRIVALKTVLLSQMAQKGALGRFEQEAQVVAQLTHPHIVAAYDFGRHEGRLYFAMELVTGEDVHQLIRRKGALTEWTAWGIVRQAAAGLAYAAHHGIVHRDIKPANLLLVEPSPGLPLPAGLPMVKIADFGLAQLAATTDERTRLTSANEAIGSPNYMSPEQLLGEPVDLRTDIFALGASAFHMLTGKAPQAGKSLAQILAQRMSGQTESIRELRPEVSQGSVDLVAAMMAHDLPDRPADYRELTRRIDALDLDSPGSLATVALSPSTAITTETWTRDPTGEFPKGPAAARGKTSRWINPKRLTLGVGCLAAILVLVGIASRSGLPVDRNLVPTGSIEELFNGQNINQWKPVSGGWSSAKNDEGALVLQGRGLVRRSILIRNDAGEFQPVEHYRLMLAVDLHDATAVEIQFDLAGEGGDQQCLLVRVDRDGSTLGSRTNNREASAKTFNHRSHLADSGALHSVEIQRQSLGWWTLIDGELLGTAPFIHATPAPEFRLLAEGGRAWFSDFTFEELIPPAKQP
jgi:eukaryotic-like serine/threonine-protein kinase